MSGPPAKPKGAGFGPMYRVMRWIGDRSQAHFLRDVLVVGGEDVPKEGPIIVCCSHFCTMIDVAIISSKLPHRRPIHYWAKRGLYKRQPFRWILENSGNIQVDRKTKNNQDLFAGTFQAMEAGEAIGLFPEGGSYTEHRLHSMKAGAAWAALEYARHLAKQGSDDPTKTQVLIVPAAINYTDKSRFRSQAIFEFGPAFSVDEYSSEFLADDFTSPSAGESVAMEKSNSIDSMPSTPMIEVGSPDMNLASGNTRTHLLKSKAPLKHDSARSAVAKLTKRIGDEIYKKTIDAPDWITWHAVKMSRELIWRRGGDLPLRQLVPISNALVAILNSPLAEARRAKESLCLLQALVIASSTDIFTLNSLEDHFRHRERQISGHLVTGPNKHNLTTSAAIPTRMEAGSAIPSLPACALYLLKQLFALAIRLPFVAPLAVVYLPAYAVGWGLSLRYASHEEESMASAKSLCAFVIATLTHVGLIFIIAALFLFTPPGWLVGLLFSMAIEALHVWTLDETYDCVKSTVASYRLLAASLRQIVTPSQLGAEDQVLQIAVEAVRFNPAIQFTFIKALRTSSSTHSAPPIADPSRALMRPPCFQFMGATLEAHARAEHALAHLFKELKNLEHHKGEFNVEVTDEVFAQWKFLKHCVAGPRVSKEKSLL